MPSYIKDRGLVGFNAFVKLYFPLYCLAWNYRIVYSYNLATFVEILILMTQLLFALLSENLLIEDFELLDFVGEDCYSDSCPCCTAYSGTRIS